MQRDKKHLREQLIKQRNALSRIQVEEYAFRITNQLLEFLAGLENPIKTIHTYLPINHEVDTWPFIKEAHALGLIVLVPETLPHRKMNSLVLKPRAALTQGKFKTFHPIDKIPFKDEPELILVPLVGFDIHNHRLGYGSGYYDTFLAENPYAIKIGLAYPFQKVDILPVEAHDQPLDFIFTGEITA